MVRAAGVILSLSLLAFFGFVLLPGGLRQTTPDYEAMRGPDPTEFEPVKGEMNPPLDVPKALAPSEENLARGKLLYTQVCVSCHGEQGRGDGPAGRALKPPARNMTTPDGWTKGYRLTALFRTLSEGLPGTSMVAYDYLPAADRFALAHYVQSLGDFDHGQDSAEEVAALDQEYRLSQGSQQANKVPVSRAMEVMAEEAAVGPLILPADDDSPGAEMCRRFVIDPQRAALTVRGLAGLSGKPDLFASAVTSGAPSNGFSAGVASLSADQWNTFHQTLTALTPGSDTRR
jgi:mono/diheme cytochrome c family protein